MNYGPVPWRTTIKRSNTNVKQQNGHGVPAESNISKIWERETFGKVGKSHRSRKGSKSGRIFTKVPRRLAFPITSIIDSEALFEEGHVFLGFSSCDQFLLSYTEKIEVSNHSGYISYVYKLHWWLFNVGRMAEKIASVRLFANEEIESSLFLCYLEWPTLKSQIVLYGYRTTSESCYITIVAVPSIPPCKQCTACSEEYPVGDSEDARCHNRCLQHGFAVHLKQALGTSKCGVLNECSLKIDGMLALNIGHSIAVISTGILEDGDDIEQLPLSSIKRAACEESVMDSELARVLRNDEQQEEVRRENAARVLQSSAGFGFDQIIWNINVQQEPEEQHSEHNQIDGSECGTIGHAASSVITSTSEAEANVSKPSVYDIGNDDIACISLVEKSKLSEDKENFSKEHKTEQPTQSKGTEIQKYSDIDPYYDPEPKTIILSQNLKSDSFKYDEYEFENQSLSQDDHTSCSNRFSTSPVKSICIKLPARMSMPNTSKGTSTSSVCSSCSHIHSRMNNCAKLSHSILPQAFLSMQNTTEQGNDTNDNDVSTSESIGLRCKSNIHMSGVNKSSPLGVYSVVNNLQTPQESLRLTPNFATPSPSASESSGSMFCCAESYLSQGFGKNVNKNRLSDGLVSFSENFYGRILQEMITPDEPLPVGESGLVYCSMFCQGAAEEMLHPIRKGQSSIQAYSQHLVLDLEHVIFDILRTRCYNAYKYGYLVDYESNITDVCSDTKSVVIHIAALLNISPHRSVPLCELSSNNRAGATIQQAEFIICWRLHTGRYEVVVARPLKTYDESKYGKWKADWMLKMDQVIRNQCSVPTNLFQSVYILNNAPAYHQRSLNVLWNSDKTFVITK